MNVIVTIKIPNDFTKKDKQLALKIHKHLVTEANNYFKKINISDKFSEEIKAKSLQDQLQHMINHFNSGKITRKEYQNVTSQIQKAMNSINRTHRRRRR